MNFDKFNIKFLKQLSALLKTVAARVVRLVNVLVEQKKNGILLPFIKSFRKFRLSAIITIPLCGIPPTIQFHVQFLYDFSIAYFFAQFVCLSSCSETRRRASTRKYFYLICVVGILAINHGWEIDDTAINFITKYLRWYPTTYEMKHNIKLMMKVKRFNRNFHDLERSKNEVAHYWRINRESAWLEQSIASLMKESWLEMMNGIAQQNWLLSQMFTMLSIV